MPYSCIATSGRRHALWAVITMAAVGAVGCGDSALDDEGERAPLRSVDCEPGATDGGVAEADGGEVGHDAATPVDGQLGGPDAGGPGTIADPAGAYFAGLTANGTGCPAGSWDTSIASDGKTFTTTFSAFEAEVSKEVGIAVKDCTVSIKVHSPAQLRMVVQDVSHGGYVFAEAGVQARVMTSYYFQGFPDQGGEQVTELVGPLDQDFLVDSTNDGAVVKSRCSSEQTLNIRTTLRLRNTEPRQSGYIGIKEAPKFKVRWERCET